MTSPDEFAKRRGEKPPKAKSHWSFVDLAGLVVLVLVLVVALPAWARTPDGREFLARQIEAIISDQIRGHLEIGSLDRVSEEGVVGHDIVFYDESGAVVLEADEAELAIDWDELTSGHVVSPHGIVRGGRVILATTASGELLLDRAFASRHPGAPGAPVGPDVVRLENLEARDVELLIAIHGAVDVRSTHVWTNVLVRAPENSSAIVEASRISGHMHVDSPLPIDLDLARGHFELDGSARRRSSMVLPATMGGEGVRISATILADADETLHVDVRLHPESVGAVFTGAALFSQALVAETLTDALDVTVDF